MHPVAEKVARNDAAFRRANERIEGVAEGMVEEAPFLCECADETCTEIVMLDVDAYHEVRSSGRRFVVAPGHEENAEEGLTRVISREAGHVVVEKVGEAGSLAEKLAEEDS